MCLGLIFVVLFMSVVCAPSSSNYNATSYVVGSGGSSSSANYNTDLTVGQVAVENTVSDSYNQYSGFWQSAAEGNVEPNISSLNLVSVDGENKTTSDLNCSFMVIDEDSGDTLDVTVRWIKDGVLNFSVDYNNSYSNGTVVSAILNSGNTSKGENWSCSVRAYDGADYSGWVNSSEVSILNSLPTVTLINLSNWSSTTDRTPVFNWSGEDADGDDMTYEIAINEHKYAGGAVCYDNRSDDSLTDEFYIPSSDLLCFHDIGYYYNWSVRANDGEGWGEWATQWHFNLSAQVLINLTTGEVDFGSLDLGDIVNTTDGVHSPLVLENDGNCMVNVSLNSSALWEEQQAAGPYYQFKVDNVSGEDGAFSWIKSVVDWFNMPIADEVVGIVELDYSDQKDSSEIDVRLEVPPSEAPGVKNATVVFTGELAE